MISYEDFKKVEIKIGKIISAEKIPDTEKLLLLKVDFAEDTPRQIVSGIAAHFSNPISLIGVKCAFATNLDPRIIRGYESRGMILAVGGTDSPFSLLKVNEDSKEGSIIK